MDTHKEDAAVETIPILTAEEVDGIEEWTGWREEGFERDIRVEDYCVAVNPAAIDFSEILDGLGKKSNDIPVFMQATIYLHNPLSSFFPGLSQFVDYKRQKI